MTRLALVFLLALAACSPEQLEKIAVAGSPERLASFERNAIAAECRLEAGRQRALKPGRVLTVQWEEAYLAACQREIAIMRAYGRR